MFTKRCWLEIDTNIIADNYQILRKHLSASQEIMAVVKANAYGHGDVKVAEKLQTIGVKNFAVSNAAEAVNLRHAGIAGQILVLGYTPVELVGELSRYNITQTIISEEYAKALEKLNTPIKVQIAIDTGMQRIGFDAVDLDNCERFIRKCHRQFNVMGLFTHLCAADDYTQKEFTDLQIERFKKVVDRVADIRIPFIHCMNSAGALWQCEYGNMSRLGIVLYGLKPAFSQTLPKGIRPALSWKTVVSMTKDVKAGESIGYGRSFYADRKMKIAVLATGYADGYSRFLSNKGYVLIHGQKAQVIGKVCMDQMMVDISHILNVKMGDEAVLVGNSGDKCFTADDMGNMIGTIGYEIVCNISNRVERVWLS